MEVVAPFIEYLLQHGKLEAALLVGLIAIVGSAVLLRRGKVESPPAPTAAASGAGQTTQVNHVRAKGDVTVSPEQRHG